jgi:ubiquinone/menaquinone biosynthesis C-methylase UbiE
VDHADHLRLLRDGVARGGTWADLGAGTGAFTLALAELVGPDGAVIAVDRDRGALRELERAVRPGGATVSARVADFTKPIDLGPLDGIVMANSLHFVKDKTDVLALVRGHLTRGGRLLLVEYDSDRGNEWVPYPVSLETWLGLAERAGFRETRLMHAIASRFLGRIYSALSLAP